MRSTLLASCLLILSFGVLGCDDGMKKADTPAAPAVTPGTPDPGKGGMDASGAGKMEGPGAGKMEGAAPATTEPSPAPATGEPKKEDMPK